MFIDNAGDHPRAVVKMYKIHVIFMLANTVSILQATDQELILTFKSSTLKKMFCKAVAATDSDSSDGCGQSIGNL